jgi:hypothetical protein
MEASSCVIVVVGRSLFEEQCTTGQAEDFVASVPCVRFSAALRLLVGQPKSLYLSRMIFFTT